MDRINLFGEQEERIFTIMKICDFKDQDRRENEIPHLHQFYSIFWLQHGQAVHATDFVEYVIEKDTILFVPPGLKHRMILDPTAGGFSILFNEEFVRYNQKNYTPLKEYELFNNPEFKSMVKVEGADKDELNQVIELMIREVECPDTYTTDVVLNLLHLFLLKAIRLFETQYQPLQAQDNESDNFSIIRFKELIEENYIKEKSVSVYADQLNMSPACLNEVSKKTAGITAGEMIRNRVIDEAKQKLYATDLSGKEIAYSLGFDDPSYFSRFFKKYTGLTLKAFRDATRKKYH